MIVEELFVVFRTVALILSTAMLIKYCIFLFLAPFYPVKEKRRRLRVLRKKEPLYSPLVSVIIPAWNEQVGIIKTINSILDSTYKNIQIVVIDDGSTDDTLKIVKEYKRTSKLKEGNSIKILSQSNLGKGPAMNNGIRKSKGEIIMTVDADSMIERNAIENLVRYFQDKEITGAVGNVRVQNNDSLIGILQQLEYQFGFYFKRAHAVMGAEYIFGGACAAFRKDVFEKYGYFDEYNKTEDIEFSMRLRYFGEKCTYMENVICYTEGASTIKGLLNQRLRWKKGRFDTFIKYRNLFFSLDSVHNKALSWFVLPFAMLSEIQLFFEPIALLLLLTYSVLMADYISLAIGLGFVFIIYFVNAFFSYQKINLKLILLFPFTWILMYFLIWIEFLALIKSLRMLFKGENIKWQQWQRRGLDNVKSLKLNE